jgi:hypothetical protein
MRQLNLPAYEFKTIKKKDKTWIFDPFRKGYFVLTPEEWVRQHFLMWLTKSLGYPEGLTAVETSLKYNTLQMRADVVIYNRMGKPLMIIECKAPHVQITEATLEQAARYNYSFKTQYLALTNGMKHYCCRIDLNEKKLIYLETFPHFDEIS